MRIISYDIASKSLAVAIIDFNENWEEEIKNDFPFNAVTFISGSASLEKVKLNSRNPLNTDNTTNNANDPMIIPLKAIREIIVIALFLLLLKM